FVQLCCEAQFNTSLFSMCQKVFSLTGKAKRYPHHLSISSAVPRLSAPLMCREPSCRQRLS
ncbi:hypothetical protein XENORESO_020986, partial [Xenotaenia resolanae]